MSSSHRLRVAFVSLLTIALGCLVASCGCSNCDDAIPQTPGPGAEFVSTFVLEDVNPNSATFQAIVTPRQQLTRVSAWYFGHAT